jgi:hypothetical protein
MVRFSPANCSGEGDRFRKPGWEKISDNLFENRSRAAYVELRRNPAGGYRVTRDECLQALTVAVRKRLVIYADRVMAGKSWCGEPPGLGNPPRGTTAEDVVSSCILKLLRNPEKWDASRGNLYKYMTLLISAEVARIANTIENKYTMRLFELFDDDDETGTGRRPMPGRLGSIALHTAPTQNDQMEFNQAIQNIQGTKWSKDDIRLILNIMIDEGITKARDLSLRSNIPIDRVYAIKAEIRRKLQALRPVSSAVTWREKGSKG